MAMTNQSNDDQSRAYPSGGKHGYVLERGLTKRELFAAMAMQGALPSLHVETRADIPRGLQLTAEYAVQAADALLSALDGSKDWTRPDRHHLGTTIEEREP